MSDPKIDLGRYRKVRWFFTMVFLQTLWWDVILNRPVLNLFRIPSLPRWREIARRYRALAVEMGGVLIKLGQFLSIRVDILPVEITSELSGLQDEVPPVSLKEVTSQIEKDFGRPLSEVFQWISPQALGAASLAQVHRVRLLSGKEAVVKVLRPGIDVLVETDLAALSVALRWLKLSRRVSERVDLDWLAEEFTTVTRNELDLASEGRNAESLAEDFAGNPSIYIPKVYWDYSGTRILTLENVGYIKIGDLRGMEAAGINPSQVADTLYRLYMRQVFETHFVHVDPHPGNLFVKPLPHPDEAETGVSAFAPGDPIPCMPGRPFQIAFVDFGMAVHIPERLRAALREYAIGFGTRDAHKIVQSLVNAGTLRPGADLGRLEEAHKALFDRLWGVRTGQFRDIAMDEMRYFLREYRDVIYDAPFQFQADMLFVVRALGILSGMATHLDPDFDVWSKTMPFAEQFAREELRKNWQEHLHEVFELLQKLTRLPLQLDQVLTQTREGKLNVQVSFSPYAQESLGHLERSIKRLTWMILAGALLISGVTLHVGTRDSFFSQLLVLLSLIVFLGTLRK